MSKHCRDDFYIRSARGPAGPIGPPGLGMPAGGAVGQFIAKKSSADFDFEWSVPNGAGNMLTSTYDPTNKASDAFNMDNMADGSTKRVYTSAEKTKVANIDSTISAAISDALATAIPAAILQAKMEAYPVGSTYTNVSDATNPATLLGFGTWVAYAAGQVMVGKASSGTFATAGASGGSETHTLTEAQLPSISGSFTMHGQESGTMFYNRSGYTTGGTYGGYKSPGGTTGGASSITNPGFAFGQNQPHNNLQPYIVVYVWRRTA